MKSLLQTTAICSLNSAIFFMNLTIEETEIPEVKLIKQFKASDLRGEFVKPFHAKDLQSQGIDFQMRESFYSISKKNVIRGMHFHAPPFEHEKIVFCTQGAIVDVALDLRKNAATYGQFVSRMLSQENGLALLIPKGFAHGFCTLSEQATTFYFISGEYEATADGGVLYSSFGFDWNVSHPILSERDKQFETLIDFKSPFNL